MTWPHVKLSDVADVVRGVTFSKADVGSERSDTIPILRAGNIQDVLILDEDLVYLSPNFVSEKQILRSGDIVMCMSSGSANVLGKSALLKTTWRGSFDAFLAVIRARPEKVDANYLAHYFREPAFRKWASSSNGIGIKNIRLSDLAAYEIPLPPREEQKRIAGILDQADALRRLRARVLEKLNPLGQAVFQEMFGAHHSDWPEVLLTDFVADKDDIKCGPFGTQLLKSEFQTEGVPLWGIKQVNKAFSIPTHEYVSEKKFRELQSYSLEANDIVMTCKGTVGNCAVYPDHLGVGVMHSDLLRVRVDQSRHNPIFLADQFHYSQKLSHQIDLISGGAIMAGINVGKLKALKALAPPREVQNEYATKIERIRCEANKQAASLTSCIALFASLQSAAFEGKL